MEPVGEFTPCFLRVVARFSAHADPNTLSCHFKLSLSCVTDIFKNSEVAEYFQSCGNDHGTDI
jgi:hypothetical protein